MSIETATNRVYNFSAGPAILPESVLKEIKENIECLPGVGSSVLEISHRSADFVAIQASAKARIERLLNIPDTHEVLFLQGGSRLQFSMVPMNFLKGSDKTGQYLVTGSWGKKAFAEAKREGKVNMAWDGKESSYSALPSASELPEFSSADTAYVYYTSNETIEGVQFPGEPVSGDAPLVCDASSDFMHKPLDISKFGLIYACAQKNAGPAGITIVIVRKDWVDAERDDLPGYLNYQSHIAANSMFNTPPTFGVYVVELVAKWLEEEMGGLEKMYQLNQAKAAKIYDVVDKFDGFYNAHAAKDARSLMNVTFNFSDEAVLGEFIAQAKTHNLCNLSGHRSVGGIRASIYNAMPIDGVDALAEFMTDFATKKA